ncbi:MAG: hypothetical protein GY834_02160 [Bacteroidetes bacterium]|nr:hypothetical protein [Bacteroidota bacterium]
MKAIDSLSKVLNIKKGEGSTILLLIIFSFFLGIGIAFYYTATTSLLLTNFEREILPFAYIGGGVVVYLLSLVFDQLQKRIKTSNFLLSAMIFLLLSVVTLLVLYLLSGSKWLTLALFIWMRVFAYVQGISFWGLASRIFNLRQGKRLFGLISAGEVLSHILIFFSVPFLLQVIDTEDLLYLSLAGLGFSLVFMFLVVKKFSGKLSVIGKSRKEDKPSKKKSQNLLKNKYFSLIFILAFIPVLANVVVDFVFLTQTKQIFSGREVLSGFIAIFFGITAIVEFFSKTFLSGRIINEYGIKVGLPALPFLLGISTLLAVIAGAIFGVAGIFFSFIVLSKLFMRAIRTSLYEPSFQILFQPIEKSMRLAFQSRIEGGPKAFGNIIAGGILLLFSSFSFSNLIFFNYLLLVIVLYWLYSSLKMTKEYRNVLNVLLSGGADIKKNVINNKSSIGIILSALHTSNKQFFRLLISLLDKFDVLQKESALTNIFSNSTSKIKETILSIIREKRIIISLAYLEKEVEKETSVAIQENIDQTISLLKETDNIPFSKIEELANSANPSDRVSVAVLLGKSRRYNARIHIFELCKDKRRKVIEEALIAAGHSKNSEFWEIIINNLASPSNATAAFNAAKIIGPRILDDIDQFYSRMAENKAVQFRIIKLYGEIGDKRAEKLLRSLINSPDKEIRYKTLDYLSRIKYSASSKEKPIIKKTIEEEVSDIIYLSASLLDLDSLGEDVGITKALKYELHSKRLKLFKLLSVLYESKTIQYARQVLAEESKESRVFALEIMDMVLSEDIKATILPIFDELSDEELIGKYSLIFPQEKLGVAERLGDLINTHFTCISNWTRSSAIRLLENYPSEKAIRIIAANIIHSDLLIRDTALRSLYSMDTEKFIECVRMLNIESRKIIFDITNELVANKGHLTISMLDKIKLLANVFFLADVQETLFVKLAINSKTISFSKDEKISIDENYFMIIIKGTARLIENGTESKTLKVKDIIGEISPDYLRNPDVKFISNEKLAVMQISIDLLYELMIDNQDITEGLVLGLVDELSVNLQQKKSESYV